MKKLAATIAIIVTLAPLAAQAGNYTTTRIGQFDFINGPGYNATVTHIGQFDFINGTRDGHNFSGTTTHIGQFGFTNLSED